MRRRIRAHLRVLGHQVLRRATQTAKVLAPGAAAIALAVTGVVLWGAAVWSLVEWTSPWIDPTISLPSLVLGHAALAFVLLRAGMRRLERGPRDRAVLTQPGQLDSKP